MVGRVRVEWRWTQIIKRLDLRNLAWGSLDSGGSVGMLPKAIFKVKNKKYYVKMSAYNPYHGVYGIESISEVMASRLADILKVPSVPMELVSALVAKDGKEFETYLCISPDYKKEGDRVVPFEVAYENRARYTETPLEFAKRIGIVNDVYRMFIFDYIIANLDRHGANIELYLKNLRMAPLFDNGNSLYATRDESEVTRKGYYVGHDNQANNFVGHRSLLGNLYLIDRIVPIGTLKKSDRAMLFKDLGKIISRGRRDAIWRLITRRYEHAREVCNFKRI